VQGWLWDCFTDCLSWAKGQIQTFAPEYSVVLLNGDLMDGPDHHKTYQTISRHPGAEREVCYRSMERVWDTIKPDGIVVCRGTESHVGPGGAAEEGMTRSWVDDGLPIIPSEHGPKTHWFFEGNVPGKYPVPWNASHHGRIGQRPWTTPNVVLNLAMEIEIDYMRDGLPVPRICYRSHFHREVDTGPAQRVRMIALPAFQVSTAYVHQKHAGKLADIGMMLTLIDTDATEEDDQIRVRKRIHRPKRTRKVWSPPRKKR
jgi:hypothetical protein